MHSCLLILFHLSVFSRYLAIFYPQTNRMTPKVALVVVSFIWLLPVLIFIPWAIVYNQRVYPIQGHPYNICLPIWESKEVSLEPALARFPHYINFFYKKYCGATSCSTMSTSCLFIVSSGLNTDSSCLLIPVPVVDPEGLHTGGCVLVLPVY